MSRARSRQAARQMGACTQSRPLCMSRTCSAYKRVGRWLSAMCFLTSSMPTSRLWKIPAARAADAFVWLNTSVKWEGLPAPLLAITGMVTAWDTASTSSRSKPCPTPSLSMQLSRISPAPSASTACASSTAPRSRPSRPPLMVHCHQQYCSPLGPGFEVLMVLCLTVLGSATYTLRGSMDTTTACLPYTSLICSMLVLPSFLPAARYCSATSTASEPIETLSAPDLKYAAATSSALYVLPSLSLKPRMPPPTVSGTNTRSLACLSTSSMGRSARGKSRKPMMLRKVTSSAPSSKYLAASSTGLPRLRTSLSPPFSRTSYWSPLVTTRSPASFDRTSRHAITRLARPCTAAEEVGAGAGAAAGSRKACMMLRPVTPLFSGWN
mmetsp:Transcript_24178/g.52815  ORF Transcript_24178/g.52815 Transcript_24178/m.52815 type:complete len:381 (+) Transcript_24178:1082-2224(+)